MNGYNSFPAKYKGFCTRCDTEFPEGTLIYRDPLNGILYHVSCPDSVAPARNEICPKCFMEKANSGKCGCYE